MRRPKSEDAARDERFVGGDLLENFLGVFEQLARLVSDYWIIKDCRISPTQFPNVKERRPIDMFAKIDNRWGELAGAGEFRLRRRVIFPIDRRSIRARLLERDQFLVANFCTVRLPQCFILSQGFGIERRLLL